MTVHERDMAHEGDNSCDWYAEELQESAEFRKTYRQRLSVVKAKDMPFENSPDGLIKHLVHAKQETTENCVEAYMQFIKPGSHTGKRTGTATTCTGTSNTTSTRNSTGRGRRSRASSNGSAATSSSSRPTASSSTSIPTPTTRRG